jgi:hypothetical protein
VPIGSEVKDEGDMYPIEGSSEVLEKGAMVNPATGQVEEYEELWVDLEIGRVRGEEGFVSWVLRTSSEDEERGIRGMVIRIGEWIQGVLRKGDEVCIERWRWEGKEWNRVLDIGNLELPSAVRREMRFNDRFVGTDGLVWECVECYAWR